MKIHYMKLDELPFSKIRDGIKTIELRLYDEKRQQIKYGDQIEFVSLSDTNKRIRVLVTALHRYDTFEELYLNFPSTAFGYAEGEQADPRDMLKYYSQSEQIKWGVVGIEIKIID